MSCVYATAEDLWEDLLHDALSRMHRERRRMAEFMPDVLLATSGEWCHAKARALIHLKNLAEKNREVPWMLLEMARAEGVL